MKSYIRDIQDRTRTATGHRKGSSSQTVAQWEERLAAKRLQHNPFLFLLHSIYTFELIDSPQ